MRIRILPIASNNETKSPLQLNDAQLQAVQSTAHHLLVLAGAGSGKTQVLTQRIAWAINTKQASPHSILAVTFTNRAANEMRTRLQKTVPDSPHLWIGTFHGIAHRILRRHPQEAGLDSGFQILDSSDQKRLLRRILRDMNVSEERLTPDKAAGWIERQKDLGARAANAIDNGHPEQEALVELYRQYEHRCNASNLVDFTELLLRTTELLRDNPEILKHYWHRFQHILVDEFQDTNRLQYRWLLQLSKGGAAITIVGDDDQSIYGWRNAKVENMEDFRSHFSAEVVRLEQNYRSTGNILEAANGLIKRNAGRMGKTLWTQAPKGDPIRVYCARDEYDEARYLAKSLEAWRDSGKSLADACALYRSSAQSRIVEEELNLRGIPYRIYGGLRFYDRMEIKDCLAYLTLCVARDNDPSLARIINTPTRGIGERGVSLIQEAANLNGTSLWKATQDFAQRSERSAAAVRRFLVLIDALAGEIADKPLDEQLRLITQRTGLREHHGKQPGETGISRLENIDELIEAAGRFQESWDQGGVETAEEEEDVVTAWLSQVVLDTTSDKDDKEQKAVQLLTLHSTKGLEFPLVHILGMEQDLFPHILAVRDNQEDEERRLCYVGLTRAMSELHLSWATERRRFGKLQLQRPSVFLSEIPQHLLLEISDNRSSQKLATNFVQKNQDQTQNASFNTGQQVSHARFGIGTVVEISPNDAGKLCVQFRSVGRKWLVAEFAGLQPVAHEERLG